MSALSSIKARQKEMQQKHGSSGGGNFNKLFTRDGDVTFYQAIADSTHYIQVYAAHEIKREGQQYRDLKYCPLNSYDEKNAAGYDCPYCKDIDTYPIKLRVMMWLYVHENLRPVDKLRTDFEKKLPVVEWNGERYARNVIDRPLLWDNSTWKEFNPILDFDDMQEQMNGDLTAKVIRMRTFGAQLDLQRKYAVVLDSGPLTDEQKAKCADLPSIFDVLWDELNDTGKAGETVKRGDQDKTPDQVMQDAGHKPYQPSFGKSEPAAVSGTEPEPNLPPASDPEGFEKKQFSFDPENPFGV